MNVEVNGTERALAPGSTLLGLIELVAGSTRGSAAAVDGTVVPRTQWPTYELHDGDRIEVIMAVQGG